MKSNAAIESALKTKHALRAVPELIVDWNMNRFIGATASNTPSDDIEGFDNEIFPIESIVANNRPDKGINKARVGSATVSSKDGPRFYVADADDEYKYWTSPKPSSATGVIPVFNATNFPSPEGETYTYDGLSSVRPQVVYSEDVRVNKISIKMENSWASPKTFNIQVSTSATPTEGQWTTIANQTDVGNDWKSSGEICLWYNGNDTLLTPWVSTGRVDKLDGSPKAVVIRAVRVVVTELEGGYKNTEALETTQYVTATGAVVNTDGKDSFFDLIEISAHLEADLSKYMITAESTMDVGDASMLYPIGTVTTNQGSVSLSNLYPSGGQWVPGLFSVENTNSPYHKLVDANAKMSLSYKYYDGDTFLGKVQDLTMYTDGWSGQASDTVSVELSDYSKFFDSGDIKLRPALWENLTVSEIVQRLLDSIGFVNHNIESDVDVATDHIIPIFYVDGEKTVWEVLNELSEASQTAMFFDSYGVFQVKTRDFALSSSDSPVWNLTSESDSNKLSDIATLEIISEYEPNHYKVIYQSTDWSEEINGVPTMQQVWQPDGSLVLRGTPLFKDLPADGTFFHLTSGEVKHWPYEGLVNIEGEIIRFKGKQFVYYTGPAGGTKNVVVVESNDEYKAKNELTLPHYRYKNNLTGAIKITERGAWNTTPKKHIVDVGPDGYEYFGRQITNGNRQIITGYYHDKNNSRIQLMSGAQSRTRNDMKLVTNGRPEDTPYFNYGTKFRLLKQAGRTHQVAGLVIHNGNVAEDGYYFDFTPSRRLTAAHRKNRHEFICYSRKSGVEKRIGTARVAIGENIDYELDIDYRLNTNGDHLLRAFLNGKKIMDAVVQGPTRVPHGGRFGMFIRGKTRVEYEYLYAVKNEVKSPLTEDFGFLDKVERSYMGGQWDREFVFKMGTKRVVKKGSKKNRRISQQFFDEFGPIVHEIREFDVKFEPTPVLHSRLYMSNDWSAVALDYTASPFGAKFAVANTSRRNAVLNGEDTLSFSGTGDSINQVFTVFGRSLVMKESEEVIAKNDDQIRRRGKIEAELSSPWVQSKAMATAVAEWMNANFSYGNEELSVEIFGNPLIEPGDVVNISFPDRHIDGDYFVLSTRNNFDTGLATTLTLRKRQ